MINYQQKEHLSISAAHAEVSVVDRSKPRLKLHLATVTANFHDVSVTSIDTF